MENDTNDTASLLARLEAQRAELDIAIAVIRRQLGQPQEPAAQSVSMQPATARVIAQEIASDSFFGMSIGEAALKYLRMVKRPQSAQIISEALKQGGFPTRAENFYSNVYTALTRGSEFVKVKRGEWGLASWYGGGRAKSRATKPEEPDVADDESS